MGEIEEVFGDFVQLIDFCDERVCFGRIEVDFVLGVVAVFGYVGGVVCRGSYVFAGYYEFTFTERGGTGDAGRVFVALKLFVEMRVVITVNGEFFFEVSGYHASVKIRFDEFSKMFEIFASSRRLVSKRSVDNVYVFGFQA